MRLDCELGLVVGGSTSARQIDSPTTRHIPATYKGLWTKLKKNLAHRKAGHTKKRYKGLDKPPRYISPTVTYNYGYDYGFKSEQQVSVLTLAGRIILPYQGYDLHVAFIQHGAHLGGAKLWYDKAHKQFYLLVSLELDLPDPTPETLPDVVGVDVAMRYLATTATMNNDSPFTQENESGQKLTTRPDFVNACSTKALAPPHGARSR